MDPPEHPVGSRESEAGRIARRSQRRDPAPRPRSPLTEPIWLEVSSLEDAVELVETMARHGISSEPVAAGDGFYVRVAATRDRASDLFHDVSTALEHADVPATQRAPRVDEAKTATAPAGPPRDEPPARVLSVVGDEVRRLGTHPVQELHRLEHEADAGESAATPAILIAVMAFAAWSVVVLVVAVALAVAYLVV